MLPIFDQGYEKNTKNVLFHAKEERKEKATS